MPSLLSSSSCKGSGQWKNKVRNISLTYNLANVFPEEIDAALQAAADAIAAANPPEVVEQVTSCTCCCQ